MNEETDKVIEIINETVTAVATSLAARSDAIDANPSGIEAVIVAAVLRAYTRILTVPFSKEAHEVSSKIEEEIYTRLVQEALKPA